jgi:hypothetical protein
MIPACTSVISMPRASEGIETLPTVPSTEIRVSTGDLLLRCLAALGVVNMEIEVTINRWIGRISWIVQPN